jgi:hypothetical protein
MRHASLKDTELMISICIICAVVIGMGAWLRWAIVPVLGAYRLGRALEQRVAAMNARRETQSRAREEASPPHE